VFLSRTGFLVMLPVLLTC